VALIARAIVIERGVSIAIKWGKVWQIPALIFCFNYKASEIKTTQSPNIILYPYNFVYTLHVGFSVPG